MDSKRYDLIILGGGCAGLTAGIYAGRAKMHTLIIEKTQAGGQASTTDEIGNYPGFQNITGPDLMDRMLNQAKAFGAEFIVSDVTGVDLTNEIKRVETASGVYESFAVILATGANPKKLGFEGEDEFRGRGVGYCATCDGFFFEGKDIFVIGGGYSAAEEALYLTRFGKKVTILVRKDKFRCAQSVVDKVMAHPKIEVMFHTELVCAYGDQMLKGAKLKNNKTGEIFTYTAPEGDTFGIFVFVGYQPATELYQNQIALDQEGYVITDETMETDRAGVYAAGDLRPKLLRQLVTAASDGAVAATQAEKYVAEQKERLGFKTQEVRLAPKEQVDTPEPAAKGKILTPELSSQVKEVFKKLIRPATVVSIVDPSKEKSLELAEFLSEVIDLSDKLHLETYNIGENPEMEQKIHFEYLPVAALLDETGGYTGIKFCGIPSGHEFNSLIFAIYQVAGPSQPLEDHLKQRIERIKKPIHIRIGVSLSCHFCPEVVIAAQRIASLSPWVEAEMIDIGLFPDLRKKYNLMSVPALIMDHKKVTFGSQSLENILDFMEEDD